MQERLDELVRRFLEGNASHTERDEVYRLLETDVLDELMQKELYRLQRKNFENPFGLYRSSGVTPGEAEEAKLRRGPDEILRASVARMAPVPQEPAPNENDVMEEIFLFVSKPVAEQVLFPQTAWLYRIAASIAAVAIAVAGIFLWGSMDTRTTARIHEQSLPATRIQPRADELISYTGKDVVRLPDNTEVTLNSCTILEMTKTFGDSHREVTLRGEAYFDVHHDAAKPFIIHANGVTVKVLGTAFNVRAYPGSKLVKVTVVRGLVQVGSEKEVYSVVRPHEGISVELATNEFTMHDANLTQTMDWRKDFLIFERTSLAEVLTKVDKKYDTRLEVKRYEQLKDCPLTASFSDDASLDTVVVAIAQAFGMTYTIAPDGKLVTLYDGACP